MSLTINEEYESTIRDKKEASKYLFVPKIQSQFNTELIDEIDYVPYMDGNPIEYYERRKDEVLGTALDDPANQAWILFDDVDSVGDEPASSMVATAAADIVRGMMAEDVRRNRSSFSAYAVLWRADEGVGNRAVFDKFIDDNAEIPAELYQALLHYPVRDDEAFDDIADKAAEEYGKHHSPDDPVPTIPLAQAMSEIERNFPEHYEEFGALEYVNRCSSIEGFDEATESIGEDFDYGSNAVYDVIKDHGKEIVDAVQGWTNEDEMREAINSVSSEDALQTLGYDVPSFEEFENILKVYTINREAGTGIDGVTRGGVFGNEESYFTFDEWLGEAEVLTKDALKLREADGVLTISAGQQDFLPAMCLNIEPSSFIREVVIDPSIRQYETGAITGYGIEKLTFPEDVEIASGRLSPKIRDSAQVLIGGKDINWQTLNENTYGLTTSQKLSIWRTLDENHVPVTPVNVSKMNDVFHADAYDLVKAARESGLCADTIEDVAEGLVKDYSRTGLNKDEYFKNAAASVSGASRRDVVQKELEDAFKEKYHGHVPKAIDSITDLTLKGELGSPETTADHFDIGLMRQALNRGLPAEQALILVDRYGRDKNLCRDLIRSPHAGIAADLARHETELTEKQKAFAGFAVKHGMTSYAQMKAIANAYGTLEIDGHTSMETVRAQLSRLRGAGELEKVRRDYPELDWNSLKCTLKGDPVSLGGYRARIMDPQDTGQLMIGYDTDCCQHLGGAGETAMMYGLMKDEAGFFVIESEKSGKVLAQGEAWERDKDTLVFDNLEFADDRQVSQFAPIIAEWTEKSGYENVYMGVGYNQLSQEKGIRIEKGIEPPEIKGLDDVYTDADERVAVIKENGNVDRYFADAYRAKTGRALEGEKPQKTASITGITGSKQRQPIAAPKEKAKEKDEIQI